MGAGRLGGRSDAWRGPLLLVAVIAGLFHRALLFGEVFFLRDALSWFYPSRLYLRERLLRGDLPLWIPELGLGMPFLADPANGVLYPLNLLLLLPAPGCVGQFLVAHVLLAALGTHFLARRLQLSGGAAVCGALAFALGGYTLSMLANPVYLLGIAWLPLVVGLGLGLARGGGARPLAMFSAAFACQLLTGEIQGAAFSLVLLAALWLAEPDTPWRSAGRLGLGVGAALLLASPQILATLALLSQAGRAAGLTYAETAWWSFHPLRLAEFLVGGLLGNVTTRGSYLGLSLASASGTQWPWSFSAYCGSVCLVCLPFALPRPSSRERRWPYAVAALGLLSLTLALGRHTPLWRVYQALVPGAALVRYAEKYLALATLCLALLAARGSERAAGDTPGGRGWRWLVALALGTGFLLLAALPVVPQALERFLPARSAAVREHGVAIVAGALRSEGAGLLVAGLVLLLVCRRAPQRLPWVVSGALAVQLLLANGAIAPTTAGALLTARPPVAEEIMRGTPAGEPPRVLTLAGDEQSQTYLSCLRTRAETEAASWRVQTLKMNTGTIWGVGYAVAYSGFDLPLQDTFWAGTAAMRRRILDLFSVGFVLLPRDQVVQQAGFRWLASSREPCFAALANETVLPVARPVRAVVAASDLHEAVRLLGDPRHQRPDTAVVEAGGAPLPDSAGAGRGACASQRQPGDRFVTDCRLDAPAWVVANVTHTPKWHATVDGRAAPFRRANGLVTAVLVPAGRHRVELAYTEPWLWVGVALACATALSLLAALGVELAAARRNEGHRSGT